MRSTAAARALTTTYSHHRRQGLTKTAVVAFTTFGCSNLSKVFGKNDGVPVNCNFLSGPDQWTVPVGRGAGKLFKIGKLPVNRQLQAFYHADRPDQGADWSLRFQVQLLFPK